MADLPREVLSSLSSKTEVQDVCGGEDGRDKRGRRERNGAESRATRIRKSSIGYQVRKARVRNEW